jgi:hypothetical protein
MLLFVFGSSSGFDRFTFSVVPGFFGSFWCPGIEDVFEKFFTAVISTNFEIAINLGRVVLTIPEFGFFIEKLFSEMKQKGRLIWKGTTAAAYVEDFANEWRLNRDFCPSLVVSTLRVVGTLGSGDVVRFFNESFLRPTISHGRVYHLHEVCYPWSADIVASLIEAFSGKAVDMADCLIKAECPTSLPTFPEVLLVRPDLGTFLSYRTLIFRTLQSSLLRRVRWASAVSAILSHVRRSFTELTDIICLTFSCRLASSFIRCHRRPPLAMSSKCDCEKC